LEALLLALSTAHVSGSRHRVEGAGAGRAPRRFRWREVEASDAQIHGLVYELYGLTKEDIAIVQGRA
jgi:hypothetical protein